MRLGISGLIMALTMAGPALAAGWQADLGPMPLDDETKVFIAGRGDATADLDGRTLVVAGRYSGVPSNVTSAHLLISPAIGVPGRKVLSLDVSGATEGTIAGRFPATRALRDALRTGRLYIQVDSEKAPPGYSWGPKGTLWGWLLPAHERGVPGVPQQGRWFIPQLDTPSR